MRFKKTLLVISIFLLFLPLVQFIFLYQTYSSFPSYLKFEGTSLLYGQSYSSLVNYTIEGPGKLVSGVQAVYDLRMLFWGFKPRQNFTKIILRELKLFFVYNYRMSESFVFSLNNFTVIEGGWLNLTLKLTSLPVVPHLKEILGLDSYSGSLLKSLSTVLSPVKEVTWEFWLQGYVTINNKTIMFSEPLIHQKNIFTVVLFDWSPFILYQLITLLIVLLNCSGTYTKNLEVPKKWKFKK